VQKDDRTALWRADLHVSDVQQPGLDLSNGAERFGLGSDGPTGPSIAARTLAGERRNSAEQRRPAGNAHRL
jgi:hypothetical protein